jgi:alpha-tubulin suppressor-like RCC1 family protein
MRFSILAYFAGVAFVSKTVVTASDFGLISAGASYTCIIDNNVGSVKCTGENAQHSQAPLEAIAGGSFAHVSSGMSHTCAVVGNNSEYVERGYIRCWGKNDIGQAPSLKKGNYSQVAVGPPGHTCAIIVTGEVECWGTNFAGAAQTNISGTFSQIDAGTYHTCAISTDKNVKCWGSNWFGQAPESLTGGVYKQLSAGFHHTCVTMVNGTVDCFGENNENQVNCPAGKFKQVAVGGYHSCALFDDEGRNRVTCWGDNAFKQAPAVVFPALGNGFNFSAINAGASHTCAYVVNATSHKYAETQCWGWNFESGS